jgi:hypothetical protein
MLSGHADVLRCPHWTRHHLLVPPIWVPRHAGEFYNRLLLFAIKSMIRGFVFPLKRLRSTWADKAARLVHIPRGPILVIPVRRPAITWQSGHLVRRGIDTARCPKIPARGSDTRPYPWAVSL